MTANLVTFVENPVAAGPLIGSTNTTVVIVNSNTITTAGLLITRVNPGGAVTGIILQQGTVDGQIVIVENDAAAANTVTFAAAGTSFVANGVTTVIAGLTAVAYVWNGTTGLWYPVV